jgi:hypothetical protein
MHLTEEQLIKFQELYKKHFNLEITRQEALEKGLKLVRLVKLICEE